MNCVARDDIESLFKRKQGETIVCAAFHSVSPIEISDQSGEMSLTSIPKDESISAGDICLLLFECFSDKRPEVKRITLIPEELVPLYQYLLAEYRKDENREP